MFFMDTFGREKIPHTAKVEDLFGWPFGDLSRGMILQEIESELAVRNSIGAGSEMVFSPICDIEYEDGAKMTTVVGIFHSSDDKQLLEQCHFETLDFLPHEPRPVRISGPKLTLREFKKLESQLPLLLAGELQLGSIPEADAKRFAAMYRYLPNFAVLEG